MEPYPEKFDIWAFKNEAYAKDKFMLEEEGTRVYEDQWNRLVGLPLDKEWDEIVGFLTNYAKGKKFKSPYVEKRVEWKPADVKAGKVKYYP